MEILFIFRKRNRETISSPINKTPVINSPNNSVSTRQDLQTQSLLNKQRYCHFRYFRRCDPFQPYGKINSGKKSDKQQQTQNIKIQF